MFTNYQLSNFSRYLNETPKHMLGIDPGPVLGAYDAGGAVGGARAHGFRRGINMRQFARGGAFDAAANGENENPNMSKYGASLVRLEKYLRNILSEEEMGEVSPLVDDLCHHAKSEGMNQDDDPDDMEMDKRRPEAGVSSHKGASDDW
jgi:hypothetical protein